jgi:hypothetical protein
MVLIKLKVLLFTLSSVVQLFFTGLLTRSSTNKVPACCHSGFWRPGCSPLPGAFFLAQKMMRKKNCVKTGAKKFHQK